MAADSTHTHLAWNVNVWKEVAVMHDLGAVVVQLRGLVEHRSDGEDLHDRACVAKLVGESDMGVGGGRVHCVRGASPRRYIVQQSRHISM